MAENITNKIVQKLGGSDKIMHFLVCLNLTLVLTKIDSISCLWATVSVLVIGLIKEIVDEKFLNSKFSFKDLFADFLGVFFGVIIDAITNLI